MTVDRKLGKRFKTDDLFRFQLQKQMAMDEETKSLSEIGIILVVNALVE